MYHSGGRLPSKKYHALPWGMSTTVVACTRVADYHPKYAVHYRGAEYKKYRALPWCLNTAVNVTNLKNRYREEPGKFRNVFEAHRSASLGPEIERPSTRYQPLDYSRILPWLIVRPCPTLGSAVAHGSESFVGVVHSQRYVICIHTAVWQYSSRVNARIAALLAVRTGHSGTAVVVVIIVVVQQ